MRPFLTAPLFLTVLSTLVACSSHRESHSGEATHSDYDLAMKPRGGQPGAVELRGSLVTAGGEVVPAITLRRATGRDLKGDAVRVTSRKKVTLSTNLRPADLEDLAGVKDSNRFAQFGCARSFHEYTTGHRILRFDPGPTLNVRADVVILCEDVTFEAEDIRIVANRIVLVDARFKISGTAGSKFSLLAGELVLHGVSTAASKGTENLAQFGAPSLTFVANHLMGLGRLNVEAVGNDLVAVDPKK